MGQLSGVWRPWSLRLLLKAGDRLTGNCKEMSAKAEKLVKLKAAFSTNLVYF
jgi:hypothetical protein